MHDVSITSVLTRRPILCLQKLTYMSPKTPVPRPPKTVLSDPSQDEPTSSPQHLRNELGTVCTTSTQCGHSVRVKSIIKIVKHQLKNTYKLTLKQFTKLYMNVKYN